MVAETLAQGYDDFLVHDFYLKMTEASEELLCLNDKSGLAQRMLFKAICSGEHMV